MNTIDEIALRVAEKLEPRGRTYSPDHYIEFAHALLAELSKQEPVAYVSTDECGMAEFVEAHFGNIDGGQLPFPDSAPLFTHPLPVEEIEQQVAEAIAKMINTAGTYEASFLADNVVGGNWREYR